MKQSPISISRTMETPVAYFSRLLNEFAWALVACVVFGGVWVEMPK